MIFKNISLFKENISRRGCIVALDYSKSILGVAVSDVTQIISSPLTSLNNNGHKKLFVDLQNLLKERSVLCFVIGWPLSFDGSENDNCKRIYHFAEQLLAIYSLPILLMDERFTSKIADTLLIKSNKTHAQRKHLQDKIAASLILETYLNATRSF